MASRCEKERDPIPIFPRGASFHSSFLSRLRHPGHKLTKWPAILDPGRRRATKNNARFLCDLESTRLSLSPRSAGFGAARAFLLFTPSWKKGRFAWKLGSSRAGTTATRRRCRSIRQGWRKKGGGRAGQGRRGSGGGKGTRGPGRPLEIHLNRHPIFRFARHIVAAAAAAAAAAAVVVVRPASRYCVTLRDATGEEEIRRTISSNRLLLLSADHAGAPWSSSMSSRERY